MKGTASSNVREVWEEALAVIRNRISRQSFEAWFRPLSLGLVEDHRIHARGDFTGVNANVCDFICGRIRLCAQQRNGRKSREQFSSSHHSPPAGY